MLYVYIYVICVYICYVYVYLLSCFRVFVFYPVLSCFIVLSFLRSPVIKVEISGDKWR